MNRTYGFFGLAASSMVFLLVGGCDLKEPTGTELSNNGSIVSGCKEDSTVNSEQRENALSNFHQNDCNCRNHNNHHQGRDPKRRCPCKDNDTSDHKVCGQCTTATKCSTEGLVAHYPFTGNADDWSGNDFNGLVANAALSADRFGNPDRAYYFNGASSGISATVDTKLSLSMFTLCSWIKPAGAGSFLPRIIAVGPTGTSTHYYSMLYENGVWAHASVTNQRIIFFNGNTANGMAYDHHYSHTPIDTLSWHHCAITFDGAQLKIYIDGQLDKDTVIITQIQQFTNTAILQMGYSENLTDRFNGKMDDVRVYNRVLSASEIQCIYNLKE
jgi:hypothetical protein